MLGLQTSTNPAVGTIALPARFDFTSSAKYRAPFVHLLHDTDTNRIVLNFAEVDYLDSGGIGTLIAWHKNCEEKGKELVMENCGGNVMKLFKMFSFDRMFHFS